MADSVEMEFILKMRDEASRILREAGAGFDDVGDSSDKAASKMDKVTRAAQDTAKAFVAVKLASQSVRATLGDFREYEVGMVEVRKTTNLAMDEIRRFSSAFDEISIDAATPISAMQNVAAVAGQLGIQSVSDILAFTDTVSKMGVATNLAGGVAATTLARMLGVYGESASDVEHLADVMVRLGNNSKATEFEIARVAQQVALQTATFKIGTTNASAIGARLAEMGVQAEVGGSAVGRVFKTMEAAIQEGGVNLAVFAQTTGKSTQEFAESFSRDPMEAFLAFEKGLGSMIESGDDYLSVLKQLRLDQTETTKSVVPLAQNYEELAAKVNMANQAAANGGDLNREYEIFAQTLDAQLQTLSNTTTVLSKNLGAELAPATITVVGGLREMLQAINDAYVGLEQFGAAGDVVQKALAGLVIIGPGVLATVATLRAARSVLGVLAPTLVTTAGGARLMGAAFAASTGPIGLAIAGLTALSTIYMSYASESQDAIAITEANEKAMEALEGAYRSFGRTGGSTVETLDLLTEAQTRNAKATLEAARAELERARSSAESVSLLEMLSLSGNGGDLEALKFAKQELAAAQAAFDALRDKKIMLQYQLYADTRVEAQRIQKEMSSVVNIDIPVAAKLVNSIAPAIKKMQDLADSEKELAKLLQVDDKVLQDKLKITREQANAIVERGRQVLLEQSSAVEQSILASEEAIAVLSAEKGERSALAGTLKLEAAVRKAGLDLLGEETRARIELAKTKILEADRVRRQVEFNDSLSEEIDQLRIRAQVSALQADSQDRAAALAKVRYDAEKAGITDVTSAVEGYAKAWDAARQAQLQADVRKNVETDIRSLMADLEVAGLSGDARTRQMQLITTAIAAQKAGISDATPILEEYIAAWEKLDATQQGSQGALSGVNAALDSFIDEGRNTAEQFEDITRTMLDGFIDNTVDTLAEGKASWSDYFKTVGKLLIRSALTNYLASNLNKSSKPDAAGAQAAAGRISAFQLGATPATAMWVRAVGPAGTTTASVDYASTFDPSRFGRSPTTSRLPQFQKGLGAFDAGRFANNVDPRLVEILKEAAELSGNRVSLISGYRKGDSRAHGKGLATDVRLTDAMGNFIGGEKGHYQTAEGFRDYEKFAQAARMVQMEKYPELADQFRWGGYFGGRKGNYGSLDGMHFDLYGGNGRGMAGGSWETGLNQQQRGFFPGIQSAGMAQTMQELAKAPQTFQGIASGLQAANPAALGFTDALQGLTPALDQAVPGLGQIAEQLLRMATQGGFGGSGQVASILAKGAVGLFANGGISDKPAIFGEGRLAEAAVPLPDGRNIPVKLRGLPAASNSNSPSGPVTNVFSPTVQITNQGNVSKEDSEEQAAAMRQELEDMFDRKFAERALDSQRGGGLMRAG